MPLPTSTTVDPCKERLAELIRRFHVAGFDMGCDNGRGGVWILNRKTRRKFININDTIAPWLIHGDHGDVNAAWIIEEYRRQAYVA